VICASDFGWCEFIFPIQFSRCFDPVADKGLSVAVSGLETTVVGGCGFAGRTAPKDTYKKPAGGYKGTEAFRWSAGCAPPWQPILRARKWGSKQEQKCTELEEKLLARPCCR